MLNKVFVFLNLSRSYSCVKGLLSVRMSDVGTVSPHALVGYCILWWLISTQDVPTELLEGLKVFFVVKWIDCFRAVCLRV